MLCIYLSTYSALSVFSIILMLFLFVISVTLQFLSHINHMLFSFRMLSDSHSADICNEHALWHLKVSEFNSYALHAWSVENAEPALLTSAMSTHCDIWKCSDLTLCTSCLMRELSSKTSLLFMNNIINQSQSCCFQSFLFFWNNSHLLFLFSVIRFWVTLQTVFFFLWLSFRLFFFLFCICTSSMKWVISKTFSKF